MTEAWLNHPAVQGILGRLIDLTDQQPVESRARAPGFRINPDTVPLLFAPATPGDDAFVWSLVQKLEAKGWVGLRVGKVAPGRAAYESYPYLTLVAAHEGDVRRVLGREERPQSEAQRWRVALERRAARFPGSVERMATQPLRIPGRTPEEIADCLLGIVDMVPRTAFLREVSAKLFWGLSKVLDNREDAVAGLLGLAECPFPEKPIVLHAHVPPNPSGVLFVENEIPFIAACTGRVPGTEELALVFAAGFKSSAKRLRSAGGASMYFSEASLIHLHATKLLVDHIRGEETVPTYFWGDLDFSGMAILKALRDSFVNVEAWQLGYGAMIANLAARGHLPAEGAKEGQVDPGETGCAYADSVLLPELRRIGRFLDQEIGQFWE